jgi:hypothetical protein
MPDTRTATIALKDEATGEIVTYTGTLTIRRKPRIDSISPLEIPEAGGATVTLTGANFTPGSMVLFNDVPGTDVTVSDDGTTVTVVSPAV